MRFSSSSSYFPPLYLLFNIFSFLVYNTRTHAHTHSIYRHGHSIMEHNTLQHKQKHKQTKNTCRDIIVCAKATINKPTAASFFPLVNQLNYYYYQLAFSSRHHTATCVCYPEYCVFLVFFCFVIRPEIGNTDHHAD